MGLASYFEDIQKVRDDAEHFRAQLRAEILEWTTTTSKRSIEDAAVRARERVVSYAKQLDRLVEHLDNLLNLATEPDIELASETIRLRSANTRLLAQIEGLEKQLKVRKSDIDGWRTKHNKDRAAITDLKRKQRRTEQKIERLAEKDLGSLLDAYPPPGSRK